MSSQPETFQVIPAVDILGTEAVRLLRGDYEEVTLREADPFALIERVAAAGAEIVHVVDLSAARAGGVRPELVARAVAAAAPARVQAAGGVRSTRDAAALVAAGAERVVVGTAAFSTSRLLDELVARAGREARRRDRRPRRHRRGRRLDAARPRSPSRMRSSAAAQAGASRLLCTAIERDGTLGGPSFDLLAEVCALSGLRVLAAGGIRSPDDLGRSRQSAARAPSSVGRSSKGSFPSPRSGRGATSRVARVIDALRVAPGSPPGSPRATRATTSASEARRPRSNSSTSSRPVCPTCRSGSTRRAPGASSSCSRGSTRPGRTASSAPCSPASTRSASAPTSFGVPTETELAHDYLWRIHAALPPRGTIGVFNRSHYEDVVAVRMHELAPEDVWRRRPAHIRAWEEMLVDEGTAIVKVFLNVSRDEQQRRFQERIDDPAKRWKFRMGDLEVRERFDEYVAAWEDVISETSTDRAPWHVVPADRNWVKSTAVATHRRGRARTPRPEAARAGARPRRTGDRVSPTCSHLDSIAVTELPRASARVRGVRQDRRPVGAPAHVPAVREGRLLRQLAEPPRNRALRGDGASADPLRRAVRGVEVVLRRPVSRV